MVKMYLGHDLPKTLNFGFSSNITLSAFQMVLAGIFSASPTGLYAEVRSSLHTIETLQEKKRW